MIGKRPHYSRLHTKNLTKGTYFSSMPLTQLHYIRPTFIFQSVLDPSTFSKNSVDEIFRQYGVARVKKTKLEDSKPGWTTPKMPTLCSCSMTWTAFKSWKIGKRHFRMRQRQYFTLLAIRSFTKIILGRDTKSGYPWWRPRCVNLESQSNSEAMLESTLR